VRVREATPDDAAGIIALFKVIYGETTFMLVEPDEWNPTVEEQARRIEQNAKSRSGITVVAEADGRLVGAASGNRGSVKRNRHSAYVVMGVVGAWRGRGVGRALLTALEVWARANGLHRLELTVQVHNRRAITLYEKCGFEREGVKRHSLNIEGAFIDELYMSKLIAA
jgi:RimJ/RimL family protein N-acetyltransferase